jgi:hypothetical protein
MPAGPLAVISLPHGDAFLPKSMRGVFFHFLAEEIAAVAPRWCSASGPRPLTRLRQETVVVRRQPIGGRHLRPPGRTWFGCCARSGSRGRLDLLQAGAVAEPSLSRRRLPWGAGVWRSSRRLCPSAARPVAE